MPSHLPLKMLGSKWQHQEVCYRRSWLQYKNGDKKVSPLSKNCERKNFIQILFFFNGLEKYYFIVAAVSNNWRWEAAGSFETLVMNHLQDYIVMDKITHSTSWLSQKSRKNSGLRLTWQSGYVISHDSSTYHSVIQACTFLSLLSHLRFCEIIHSL